MGICTTCISHDWWSTPTRNHNKTIPISHGIYSKSMAWPDCGNYGTPNRTLMLIFWYQKMVFWYQKLISVIRKSFSDIRKSISDIRKCVNFWYQKTPRFSDIKNYFLMSEIIFWYQKFLFFYIRNSDFLISEKISDIRKNFWYQKIEFLISENHFLISENRHLSHIWRS